MHSMYLWPTAGVPVLIRNNLSVTKRADQRWSQSNQSQNFDIGVCEVSRPRPRRVVPVWGRSAVGLGIGLGGPSPTGWLGLTLYSLSGTQGERLGSARAHLSVGQGDCLSATA